ncbi:hypothetical protein SEA_WALTZ_92 [Arthrobacter phage Waltz]|nr:hypothetical protein SEA_WALTZ_92 [Arthrobacter phage Waltz]
MKTVVSIQAQYVKDGDELKTEDGWLRTGGVQPLSEDRVGILTPSGMIGAPATALVTVRRASKEG